MGLLDKVMTSTVECGKYTVQLKAIEEVEGRVIVDESTGEAIETKPYVALTLGIEGYADQVIRLYEKSLEIAARELENAYFRGQAMSIGDVLVSMINSKAKIPATKYKSLGKTEGAVFYNWSFNPNFVVKANDVSELI